MKKLILILSVAALAAMMYFNTNAIDINDDLTFSELVSMNTAEAECNITSGPGWTFFCNAFDRCSYWGSGDPCIP